MLAPDLPEIGPDLPQSISSSSLSRFSRFARNSPQLAPIRPNWPESGYASHRGHIPSQIGPKFARNSPEIRPNPRLPIRANWPGFAPIRPNRPKSVGGARSQGGLAAFCGGATRPRMAKLFWRESAAAGGRVISQRKLFRIHARPWEAGSSSDGSSQMSNAFYS